MSRFWINYQKKMKTKSILFTLFCVSLFSIGLLFYLLLNTSPYTSDNLTISMFFISIFGLLFSVFSLIGFYLRIRLSNNELYHSLLGPTIRQSVLLSTVLTGLVLLKALKVLTIWDGVMFSLSILLLEIYFQNRRIENI